MLRRVGPSDTLVPENHRRTIGGTAVSRASIHFMRRVVNRDIGYGQPNGQTGDEWVHTI
jgi:hypothetical protein